MPLDCFGVRHQTWLRDFVSAVTRRGFLAGAAGAAGALAVGAGPRRPRPRSTARSVCSASATTSKRPVYSSRRRRIWASTIVGSARAASGHPAPGRPGARDVRHLLLLRAGRRRVLGDRQPAPVEIARIAALEGASPRSTSSEMHCPGARCTYGQGDAAFRRLYVDPDRSGRWRSAPRRTGEASRRCSCSGSNEKTGKRVGPEPRLSTGLPRLLQLRLLRLQRRGPRGSVPRSCRGRSSSTRAGGAASLSTASTRRAPSGHGECRPGSRPDEVPRSRRSDEEGDRPARQAPARVQAEGTVLQRLEAAVRRSRLDAIRRRSSSARCGRLRSRRSRRSASQYGRRHPARATGRSPV